MSSRIHAATFSDALSAYACFSSSWGGYVPVTLGSWRRSEVIWRSPWDRWATLAQTVRALDEEHDEEILLGLPQDRPNAGGVYRASVLWARVEGSDQLARARRFRPLPSLVLAEGSSSRRILFWPLVRPLLWSQVVESNRKIAYALRATQKWGDPDVLWFAAPGTCLREGRSRPCPVRVARLGDGMFEAQAVVGGLKEPPARDAWMTG